MYLSLLTNGQTSDDWQDCTKYESCFNTTISHNDVYSCFGAQSYVDCNIDANALTCNGFGTCSGHKSIIYTKNNTFCIGGNSYLQRSITSDGVIECYGYNTCSNMQ